MYRDDKMCKIKVLLGSIGASRDIYITIFKIYIFKWYNFIGKNRIPIENMKITYTV